MGQDLHQTFEKTPKPLASRNLLQRTTLVAVLLQQLQPALPELPGIVKLAESTNAPDAGQHDLHAEVHRLYNQVRQEMAPLAFLYDLRIHGGLAHPPNPRDAGIAAANLGLPQHNWHRIHYLRLLGLLTQSIASISEYLATAAEL